MINFTLTDDEELKLAEWLDSLQPEISGKSYGAAGGGLTYKFTPTGLGLVIEVTEYHTQKTINLTDYSDW